VDLYAFVAHDGEMGFRALFRQRGGGGDVIVIVLAVASRTMLQQTVAPNTSLAERGIAKARCPSVSL